MIRGHSRASTPQGHIAASLQERETHRTLIRGGVCWALRRRAWVRTFENRNLSDDDFVDLKLLDVSSAHAETTDRKRSYRDCAERAYGDRECCQSEVQFWPHLSRAIRARVKPSRGALAFVRGSGLLRRRERGGILLVGFEPRIFQINAPHVGGIRALRVGSEPILRKHRHVLEILPQRAAAFAAADCRQRGKLFPGEDAVVSPHLECKIFIDQAQFHEHSQAFKVIADVY
jgi:hypothetical protein